MHRTRITVLGVLTGLALLALAPLVKSQAPVLQQPVRLLVKVPADARLEIEGIATRQMGPVRRFVSPPLEVGPKYSYTLTVVWNDQGKEVKSTKTVTVVPGREAEIDLRLAPATPDTDARTETRKEDKVEAKKDEAVEAKKEEKADPKKEDKPEREPDVIFVPTPQEVVDKMLELAEVKKGDVVYDLGCGNGIIVVTAAKKFGVKAKGFDIDPERIKESNENVKKNKVEELVSIQKKDIFTLDLSEANVVTLYLLPELNVKLMPQLEKLKPGSRIVSHDFDMKGAKPNKVVTVKPNGDDEREHTVYLWIVPWEKE